MQGSYAGLQRPTSGKDAGFNFKSNQEAFSVAFKKHWFGVQACETSAVTLLSFQQSLCW